MISRPAGPRSRARAWPSCSTPPTAASDDVDVGGIEVLGYDPERGSYRTQLFDSQGNARTHELTIEGRTWTWQGKNTRCRAAFSEDGRIQTAHHEWSADAVDWQPSMEVTLTKVE